MKKQSFVLFMIASLLVAPLLADEATVDEPIADEPIANAPIEVELPALSGKPVRLSDYRGQWVVLNYWATWCAPCRKEIPDLSNLHDSRDDITVLGLAFEDTEPEDFVAFLEDYPASYPILLVDTFNPPESLGAPRALPTTFLVNGDGVIVQTWLGPITGQLVEDWIAENGS